MLREKTDELNHKDAQLVESFKTIKTVEEANRKYADIIEKKDDDLAKFELVLTTTTEKNEMLKNQIEDQECVVLANYKSLSILDILLTKKGKH